jgi:ABC-type uncharacterized transport system auxiliary subunit
MFGSEQSERGFCMQKQRPQGVAKLTVLILLAAVLAGCSTPTYEDGTKKEYSDMPWNTPASWEGSVNIPGMGGYE